MDQLERIAYMEQLMDEVAAAVKKMADGVKEYRAVQGKWKELVQYYEGPLWRADFEDDCAGKLPAGLKRGVLSEDGVYDLLTEYDQLMAQFRELADEEVKKT